MLSNNEKKYTAMSGLGEAEINSVKGKFKAKPVASNNAVKSEPKKAEERNVKIQENNKVEEKKVNIEKKEQIKSEDVKASAEKNIVSVVLADIQPSNYNPRKNFDVASLAELAESIRQQGVLQPIGVRPIAENRFRISQAFPCRAGSARRFPAEDRARLP